MLINPGARRRVAGFEARGGERRASAGQKIKQWIFFFVLASLLGFCFVRQPIPSFFGGFFCPDLRDCWRRRRRTRQAAVMDGGRGRIVSLSRVSRSPREEVGRRRATSLRWPWTWKSLHIQNTGWFSQPLVLRSERGGWGWGASFHSVFGRNGLSGCLPAAHKAELLGEEEEDKRNAVGGKV